MLNSEHCAAMMKLNSIITMRAICRTFNVLLNVAQLVSASTLITVNNATLFTGELTTIMLCLPDQIVQNVSTTSLAACAYLCYTQRRCRGVTYSPSTRLCVTCNATSSTVAEGIQPLSEAVLYYRKERAFVDLILHAILKYRLLETFYLHVTLVNTTNHSKQAFVDNILHAMLKYDVFEDLFFSYDLPEDHTPQCEEPFLTLFNGHCLSHHMGIVNVTHDGMDWNTAAALCSIGNGHLLKAKTPEEQVYLTSAVEEEVGYWTAARWYMDYGWYWAPEATSKVGDELWANGANDTHEAELDGVPYTDRRGCLLPKHGYMMSVCSQHDLLGFLCERRQ